LGSHFKFVAIVGLALGILSTWAFMDRAQAQVQGQGCFPGLGAVIDQFRCKKNEIIKGFPQGRGNDGQPSVPRSNPIPNGTPTIAPRPVLRPLPQNGVPQTAMPRVNAPIEQPRQPTARVRRFMIYNGTDLYGGDYARSKKGKWFSKEKCVEVCRRESTCIAFTYNVKHGVCFLKDELPQYRKPYKGAVSGVLIFLRQPPRQAEATGGGFDQPREVEPVIASGGLCGSGYKTYDRVDFQGNDMAGLRVSFKTCRAKCSNSIGCTGFSWIKTAANKRCWLKFETQRGQRKSNILSCVKR